MDQSPIEVLRRFNRTFTTRIGVLDESFLGTGRPHAVARLLFEIGLSSDGVTVHALRRRLDADSGYVSRLLRHLEHDELVELRDDPTDRRRRIAQLTPSGTVAWEELNRRSDDAAAGVLSSLTVDQASRLAATLATADRLLRCSTITTELVDPDAEVAEVAPRRYFAELDQRFRDGFDAAADSTAERSRIDNPYADHWFRKHLR